MAIDKVRRSARVREQELTNGQQKTSEKANEKKKSIKSSKSTTANKKKKQSSTLTSNASKAASRGSHINIKLPHQRLTKCIRNKLPSQIDTHGFVELSNILPSQLLTNIKNHAIAKMNNDAGDIEVISNALQIDLSKELYNEMKVSLVKNTIIDETMKFVYGQPPPPVTSEGDVTSPTSSEDKGGTAEQKKPTSSSNYNGYIVETPKILVALPGSAPQLPHADDHCSSCIICLLHLSDGQEPTRVAAYDKMKDYPTGITVTCDKCKRNEMLPDQDYRRGVHLTDESWSCNCKEPWKPYDYEGKLVTAFSELLERGAPDLCDSYCGKEDTKMGDGYLALPTLIHRGPGNASSSAEPRYMLFFTLRPEYANTKDKTAHYHKYDPNLQIHAATVLHEQFKKMKKVYEGSGCDVARRFGTIVSSKCSDILGENEVLRGDYARLSKELEEAKMDCEKPKLGDDKTKANLGGKRKASQNEVHESDTTAADPTPQVRSGEEGNGPEPLHVAEENVNVFADISENPTSKRTKREDVALQQRRELAKSAMALLHITADKQVSIKKRCLVCYKYYGQTFNNEAKCVKKINFCALADDIKIYKDYLIEKEKKRKEVNKNCYQNMMRRRSEFDS